MKALKITLLVSVALVSVAALVAGVLYLMVSIAPAKYAPVHLSAEQREKSAKQFYRLVQDFINEAEGIRPFEMTLGQDEANWYLASLDEIVGKVPGHRSGSAREALEKAGLAEPMVLLDGGRLTLMVRLTKYDKVLSVDLKFGFTTDERLSVRMAGARIGRLSAPGFIVRPALDAIRGRLGQARREAEGGGSESVLIPASRARDVGSLLHEVISAVNERPIKPVFGRSKGRLVRLVRIEIAKGRMVLGFRPYGRKVIAPAGADR
ncbi:MAG: hypothetical protein ACYTF6_10155 [Planctomycetota bacterium]|jgi:hypothetical protein